MRRRRRIIIKIEGEEVMMIVGRVKSRYARTFSQLSPFKTVRAAQTPTDPTNAMVRYLIAKCALRSAQCGICFPF